MQNILHAFTEVISAEEVDMKLQEFDDHKRELLAKSESIHLLDRIRINPQLLSIIQADTEEESLPVQIHSESEERKAIRLVQYAPRLFYQLKKIDDITYSMLQNSFDPGKNRKAAFKAGESQGKSGSFFFFTHDERFLIKTISKSEFSAFMKFLPAYYKHCASNRKSLIARTYGMYKLEVTSVSSVYFYLMENVLRIDKGTELLGVFDLKGSSVNREVDEVGKSPRSTLKDCNYIRRNKQVSLLPNHS